jgi:hypothetical protein
VKHSSPTHVEWTSTFWTRLTGVTDHFMGKEKNNAVLICAKSRRPYTKTGIQVRVLF